MTNIASFNGGMGNDEFLLAEGQYVYSENLDIYRDPRWIQLAVKPTNYKTSLPGMVYIIGNATGASDPDLYPRNTYFALENKDIIDAEGTLRYDGSTLMSANPRGTWRSFALVPPSNNLAFLDYQGGAFIPYFVDTPAAPAVWYRDDDAYSDNWAPYTLDMKSYQLISSGMTKPVYRYGSGTYYADSQDNYNIIVTSATGGMDGSGAFGPGYPHIEAYEQLINQAGEVTYASVHSDSIWGCSTSIGRLYTELSAYTVRPLGPGVSQLQVDRFSKVLHGVNKNSTDILVAGDPLEYTYDNGTSAPSSAIYATVYVYKHYGFGADAQQLIAKSRYHENIMTAFGNNGITFYLVGLFGLTDYNWARSNDLVYCISNRDDRGVIYAYGKSVAGVDDGWSVIISKNSAGKELKRIGCLWRSASKNGFYYTYEDEDGVFGIDYYDDISIDTPTSYQPSGKIFLRTDDGGDMSVEKEVKELRVGCRVPENTTIKISYILDNSGTEIDYATITNTTQGTNEYKKYRGSIPVKGFKCISWFVELTTTGTTTPQLFNFNYDLGIVQN